MNFTNFLNQKYCAHCKLTSFKHYTLNKLISKQKQKKNTQIFKQSRLHSFEITFKLILCIRSFHKE